MVEKGELTAGSLDAVDKLTHSIKSIDTILAMKEGGYSNRMYARDGGSYRDGSSYARDRMGRFRSSREGSRRYSYADGYDDLISELHEMSEDLPDEKRKKVQRMIQEIERI